MDITFSNIKICLVAWECRWKKKNFLRQNGLGIKENKFKWKGKKSLNGNKAMKMFNDAMQFCLIKEQWS